MPLVIFATILDLCAQCPQQYNPADHFLRVTYDATDATASANNSASQRTGDLADLGAMETSEWTTQRLVDEFAQRRGAGGLEVDRASTRSTRLARVSWRSIEQATRSTL